MECCCTLYWAVPILLPFVSCLILNVWILKFILVHLGCDQTGGGRGGARGAGNWLPSTCGAVVILTPCPCAVCGPSCPEDGWRQQSVAAVAACSVAHLPGDRPDHSCPWAALHWIKHCKGKCLFGPDFGVARGGLWSGLGWLPCRWATWVGLRALAHADDPHGRPHTSPMARLIVPLLCCNYTWKLL